MYYRRFSVEQTMIVSGSLLVFLGLITHLIVMFSANYGILQLTGIEANLGPAACLLGALVLTRYVISLRQKRLSAASTEQSGSDLGFVDLDHMLEALNWLLGMVVLAVAMIAAATGAPGSNTEAVYIFVPAAICFNIILHWLLPAIGRQRKRHCLQLSLMTISLSLLVVVSGPVGYALVALLPVITTVAARVLDKRAAHRLLAIGILTLTCGYLLPGLSELLPWRYDSPTATVVTMQVLAVIVAGGIGTGIAHEQRRQITELEDALAETRAAESERARFEAVLQHQADFDDTCGIYNRRRMLRELQLQLSRCRDLGVRGAWLFLDLDNFKDINDSLGHRAGDNLLRSLSRTLQELAGSEAILGRFGGDEFALLLPGAGRDASERFAGRLLEGLRQRPLVFAGRPTYVTASLGIVLFPDHGTELEELLAGADMAMYESKLRGRNLYTFYEPRDDWRERLESRLDWEQRIRSALDDGRFRLFCQPIYDLNRGTVTKYELLLRLDELGGSLIEPVDFLEVAERSGLVKAIDRWVVKQAIDLLAMQVPPEISLAVNVSSKSLGDSCLKDLIKQELAVKRIDPARLIVEITETAAITDFTLAKQFITHIRELGGRVAVDDFGAGFFSFNHLKHLPIDYLKLDGGFIQNLRYSQVDQHIVKALVEVASGLGKQTIAEFVGDDGTLQLLADYGVNYAQGYAVGRPQPVTAAWSTQEEGAGD